VNLHLSIRQLELPRIFDFKHLPLLTYQFSSLTPCLLEVVTTGSPHAVLSWLQMQRNRTYGGFVDAVCDKAFVIPCWILLLSTVPESRHIKGFQYIVLIKLIVAETAAACVRFQAYFTAGGVAAPKVQGLDFSTSALQADHVGKAKQTFEMVGTALYIMPWTRYFGLAFLVLALPLAYESVRRKVKRRVMYVDGSVVVLDHKTLKFWMQAKAMGSKLIVGVLGEKKTDMVLNACACACVDQVIVEAPTKADLIFLEEHGVDFLVLAPGQAKFVTDEVVKANRCLAIGEDGVARPVHNKTEKNE
jgi:glycerol-3-phosphate cytidylyltransferase-like family protein